MTFFLRPEWPPLMSKLPTIAELAKDSAVINHEWSLKVSSTTSQRFWQERWMIPCNKPLKASYRHILGMQILLKCSVCVICFRPMNSFQKIFKAIIFLEYRHLCWPDIDRISFLKKNQCIHFTKHKILQSMKRKWYPLVMLEFKCSLLSVLLRGEANKG